MAAAAAGCVERAQRGCAGGQSMGKMVKSSRELQFAVRSTHHLHDINQLCRCQGGVRAVRCFAAVPSSAGCHRGASPGRGESEKLLRGAGLQRPPGTAGEMEMAFASSCARPSDPEMESYISYYPSSQLPPGVKLLSPLQQPLQGLGARQWLSPRHPLPENIFCDTTQHSLKQMFIRRTAYVLDGEC